jgi:hypothetical protein
LGVYHGRPETRWNSGDYERWLDEMGADFEFTPDPSFPDAGTYRGEDLRRWMRDWIIISASATCSTPTSSNRFSRHVETLL